MIPPRDDDHRGGCLNLDASHDSVVLLQHDTPVGMPGARSSPGRRGSGPPRRRSRPTRFHAGHHAEEPQWLARWSPARSAGTRVAVTRRLFTAWGHRILDEPRLNFLWRLGSWTATTTVAPSW